MKFKENSRYLRAYMTKYDHAEVVLLNMLTKKREPY